MDWSHKLKTNENEALKEIYALFRNDTLAWLQKDFSCSLDDAIDIFQMSVVILYDNVVTGKLTTLTSNIKTYLMGIARNKAMELNRSKKNIISYDDSPNIMIQYVVEENEDQILEQQLHLASLSLNHLGDPCKSLLTLYYYQDKSMEEITQQMNYKNTDTTKNQKYKCLKRLQNIYSEHKQKSLEY